VRFAAITLCVASKRVFIVISIYFFIDSVRILLDTPSYLSIITLCEGKRKGKVVPVLNQAPRYEDVLGSGDIAPRILRPRH
jgi:hypothetical protein